MRKFLIAAAAAAGLMSPAAAKADAIDMTTVTCGTLLTMDQEAITFMLTWVAGYLAGTNDQSSMDPDVLGRETEATVTYCQENQQMSVVNAARAVEGQ
jgi:opacity protein-like surface antigen